ncbi:hypothetical protein [Streptomyces sp. WELS2]|uniref:hypothetical protein n=1 Tax=Streptomyces sp. WELS2 TaxID=2749435 RepID=UPI0015F00006|nr:hypothetical protein [Streptomyces sp. WELS2]
MGDQDHTLRRFLTTLSPRPYVRAAAWDSAQRRWANRYPTTADLHGLRGDRPVAMHLFPEDAGEGTRIWAFDLDASVRREHAEHQAHRLYELLTAAGLPAVPVRSGPTGGHHIWTACEEPIPLPVLQRLIRTFRALKEHDPDSPHSLSTLDTTPWLNLRTGALRPPGAAHRLGGHAVLQEHSLDEALQALAGGGPLRALTRLTDELEEIAGDSPSVRPARAVARAVVSGRPLPPSITGADPAAVPHRRIVADGSDAKPRLAGRRLALTAAGREALSTAPHPTADHSAHAWRALVALALARCTFSDVLTLLYDSKASPGLEYFRSYRSARGRAARSAAETEALLSRQWELAVERAARLPFGGTGRDDDPAPEVTAAVNALLERMEKAGPARWSQPAGPADEAVLHCLALLALVSGSLTIDLDVRRGALLTGFSAQTVNVAIRDRLIPDGWLHEVRPSDFIKRRARTLALGTGSDTSDNAPQHTHRALLRRLGTRVKEAASELWSRLGHHLHRTFQAVGREGSTIAEVGTRTGYSRRTTLRHLGILRDQGLALFVGEVCRRTGRGVDRARDAPVPERALVYEVDRSVAAWWRGELAWLRAPRAAKTRRRATGRDGAADLTATRYPRTALGRPDHARAWLLSALALLNRPAQGGSGQGWRRVPVCPRAARLRALTEFSPIYAEQLSA